MKRCAAFLIAGLLGSTPALAQSTTPPRRLIISERAVALALQAEPAARQPRDSIKNGTIIGAVIGAVGMGIFGTLLCNALQEPDDPSCLPSVLTISAVGAGAGALAGAGLDAAFMRTGRPVVSTSGLANCRGVAIVKVCQSHR